MAVQARKRTNVVAFIVVLVVVAAACSTLLVLRTRADVSPRAVVHDADGAVYELSLDQDTRLSVESSAGTNVVVVEDGTVRVVEADCPNQDCIHQGAISKPGEQVICLPHRLWISIEVEPDDSAEMDVSAVPSSSRFDTTGR